MSPSVSTACEVQSTRMGRTAVKAHLFRLAPLPNPIRPALSDREREVLLAWFRSDSKEEAARSLYIAIGTMNTHITRIRTKYIAVGRPAATKAALFARALQDDLTQLDDW